MDVQLKSVVLSVDTGIPQWSNSYCCRLFQVDDDATYPQMFSNVGVETLVFFPRPPQLLYILVYSEYLWCYLTIVVPIFLRFYNWVLFCYMLLNEIGYISRLVIFHRLQVPQPLHVMSLGVLHARFDTYSIPDVIESQVFCLVPPTVFLKQFISHAISFPSRHHRQIQVLTTLLITTNRWSSEATVPPAVILSAST